MIEARSRRDRARAFFAAVQAKQFVIGSIAANRRAEMGAFGGQPTSRKPGEGVGGDPKRRDALSRNTDGGDAF